MAFFLSASASSAKGTLQSSREKRTRSADTPHHYAQAPKFSRNMLMKLKWKWAHDTLLSPSSHQRKIYGRFNVLCTSFNTAEAVQIQPPLRIFDSAASGGSGGDAELRLWQTVPLQVSQSLTKQRWSRTAQNVLLQSIQVSWGHGWSPSSASWGSGCPGSEDEVMALGLQRSPSALLGPEAPSHLCAVWPSGRQLLPLIIPPNGWIRFPLTSSSFHNNISPSRRPDTPSSRHRPSFLPGTTWPVVGKGLQG